MPLVFCARLGCSTAQLPACSTALTPLRPSLLCVTITVAASPLLLRSFSSCRLLSHFRVLLVPRSRQSLSLRSVQSSKSSSVCSAPLPLQTFLPFAVVGLLCSPYTAHLPPSCTVPPREIFFSFARLFGLIFYFFFLPTTCLLCSGAFSDPHRPDSQIPFGDPTVILLPPVNAAAAAFWKPRC